ncbi:VOC family protein [Nonomuraea basaltis]|uniref:VOC family protein n=1 Tax=Nonomuraea basaltis TaxID=2495887 RepID=UPI0019818105|nr:VOC family protein [Nonomuraea basaltis]
MRGLAQVAQHADDLDRATAFYRDVLGLRHIATYRPPGLAFFDLDGVRLLIERGAPSAVLYLTTHDIEADVARLRDRTSRSSRSRI